ncbi:hypothetical protein CNMCM5793_008549 [Aspergillus hiratsukae]|uniref:Uncharacterized protein n=1 Tax=Aspergillus hiratsukae TaxID=1194566 RepID=A0A8H6Q9Z2_9EURO|nr:hypothetical protein CNMCM5793_008549 [Aspergillus hiratsukae]KAF7168544.1 hypothetical protein CNMCM6106_003682 [Aspergillus hiratsukae]
MQPNPFLQVNTRHFARESRPRYLFLVHAPRSAGESSACSVRSPAALYDLPEQTHDIFALDRFDAAKSLRDHLYWKCDERCNLVTWTTSLLFALHSGLHRHRKDDDDHEFEKIFLLMIDTCDFPERTLIKDLGAVNAVNTHGLQQIGYWEGYLTPRSEYSFGVYLSQGALDIEGRCVQVSFQTLIDLGLFELFPPLAAEAEWVKWVRWVIELREPFYRQEISISTADEVRIAVQLARDGFGGRWTFPAAAMLLALKPRANNDQAILEGFKAGFSEDEIRDLSLHDIQVDRDGLPELVQFEKLVNDIHRRFTGRDISSVFWSVRR